MRAGNYVWFGVREFGMTAICNGLRLHGGFLPYSGTFLTFSDYSRNALRMAALMKIQNVLVFTHDSIGLGEDGPTHQPVEHTASLRLMPNMSVWRPCDTVETAVAWRHAIERQNGPTSLVLTRQGLPFQARSDEQIAAISRGAYVLRDCGGDGGPDLYRKRFGSRACRRSSRNTRDRGYQRPGRVDAVYRRLRCAGRGVQRVGIAGVGHSSRRGRGGRHRNLVATCRTQWSRDRLGSIR